MKDELLFYNAYEEFYKMVETVTKKVKSMYTDPNHIKVEDPGKVEGNVVFKFIRKLLKKN